MPSQCPPPSPQPWLTQAEAANLPLEELRFHADRGDAIAQTEAARKLYAAFAFFITGHNPYYFPHKKPAVARYGASNEDLQRMSSRGLHYARCASESHPQALGIYGMYQWDVLGDKAAGEQSLRRGCRAGSLEAMLIIRKQIWSLPITSGQELAALDARLDIRGLDTLLDRWRRGEALPQVQPWPDFEDVVPPLSEMGSPARQTVLLAEFESMWRDLSPCRRLTSGKTSYIPGIHIAQMRRDKELADSGDINMQHMVGNALVRYASDFPCLASGLDKAIHHYYSCAALPVSRMMLAEYLEEKRDCSSMEKVLRLGAVEENMQLKDGKKQYNENLAKLVWRYTDDANFSSLLEQAKTARSQEELAAILPPEELYYNADERRCLRKTYLAVP